MLVSILGISSPGSHLEILSLQLAHLFAHLQSYFLSVLLKVYFTFSVSLISLIQQISKQLPSGLSSGWCYAVGCHHTVDQYSPLGFQGSKLYIFLVFISYLYCLCFPQAVCLVVYICFIHAEGLLQTPVTYLKLCRSF